MSVPAIRQTDIFSKWLGGLADSRARAKITARIDRLAHSNSGDVAPVGEGVNESRIHFGPGYRVYFAARGQAVVILLCGGDKSTQAKDIKPAKHLARGLEE